MTGRKKVETHNLPTDDVENLNCTNKGKVLQLANEPRIVLWGTERMPQKDPEKHDIYSA